MSLVDDIGNAIAAAPPPGVDAGYVRAFFRRNRAALAAVIDQAIAAYQETQAATGPVSALPELWTPRKRTEANLAAMRLLAKDVGTLTDEDRRTLTGYSGWGGLTLEDTKTEAALATLPPGVPRPDPVGLIHEYYTPTIVCEAIANSIVLPLLDSLPRVDGTVPTLEPSAGIGRFLNAMQGELFNALRWTAVEMSPLSAAILRRLYSWARISEGPFEGWVQREADEVRGYLSLVLSNPPYGVRGAGVTLDQDRAYRKAKNAYQYFMRRTADLLAPDGIGVYVVPAGFLTGQSATVREVREQMLRRHHLLGAFRLPSVLPKGSGRKEALFPGALLVTDILVWRARGGELVEVAAEDRAIHDGYYFAEYPEHILGIEQGEDIGEDDQTKKKARYHDYQVEGSFIGLPSWAPRTMDRSLRLLPFGPPKAKRARGSVARVTVEVEGLPEDLADAVRLGMRVDAYLAQRAGGKAEAALTAHSELVRDLDAWVIDNGNPHAGPLVELAEQRGITGAQRFLASFEPDGTLLPELREAPPFEAKYGGSDDLLSVASWLYRQQGGLSIRKLARVRMPHAEHLSPPDFERFADELAAKLAEAGWCRDYESKVPDEWMPSEFYLVGNLWPRVDAAVKAQTAHITGPGQALDAQATSQVDRLMAVIKPEGFFDFCWGDGKKEDGTTFREWILSPRESWLPIEIVQEWAESKWGGGFRFERKDGMFNLVGYDYTLFKATGDARDRLPFDERALFFLGWTNHDAALFKPARLDYMTEEGEKKETLDMARLRVAAAWVKSWQDYCLTNAHARLAIEHAYNRLMRGYVSPTYPLDPLPIARWSPDAPKPYGYQWSAVRRIQANRRGLLAFDVGLGKTFTGCAVVALGRQEGWIKRPVILVPNSIVWKWYRDFQKVLPTYRVAVIGATRRIVERAPWGIEMIRPWPGPRAPGPKMAVLLDFLAGKGRMRIDEIQAAFPDEDVKARLKDLVDREVCTYSWTGSRFKLLSEPESPEERARKWTRFAAGGYDVVLLTYSALGRTQINVEALRAYAENTTAIKRQVKIRQRAAAGEKKPTERQQAILQEGTAAWLAQRVEIPEDWVYDPGIDWHQLGIDFLMIDESQNFKNLYMPEEREGGVPDAMGAGEASKRAWQLDFRCASVRAHTGGSGVVLLSATPAKNGPVEIYNFIYLMDPSAWQRIGITDSESFIDHFLGFTVKDVVLPNQKRGKKLACSGFRDLLTLRGVLDRFGEFKTADDVGLKIPGVLSGEPTVVDLNARQTAMVNDIVSEMEMLYDRMKTLRGNDPETQSARQAVVLKIQGLGMRVDMIALHPDLPGIGEQDASVIAGINPHAPKLDACAENILATRLEACDPTCAGPECFSCGHIVFVENVAIHTWLRNILVERGVPHERVAILNAKAVPDPEGRQQIAMDFNGQGCEGDEDYNPPQYDIVIANSVAYEGVDLQRRTCKIHHLDLPWEPATLQQRNGRGVRQGNKFDEVDIRYYFAKRSGDARRLAKIANKRSWLVSLFKGQDRSTNNPLMSEDLSPEEWIAGLTNDPSKLANMRAEQRRIEREQALVNARASAAKILGEADSLFRRAERVKGEEAGDYRVRAEARLVDLAAIDTALWPWFDIAVRVRHQPVFIPSEGPPLSEGLWVKWAGRELEIGTITPASFGLRAANTGRWMRATVHNVLTELPGFERIQGGEVGTDGPIEDHEAVFARLHAHLEAEFRRGEEWYKSGWQYASGRFQAEFWPELAAMVLGRLRARWYEDEPKLVVPAVTADGRLLLVDHAHRDALEDVHKLVPPTRGGLDELVSLAIATAAEARPADRPTWGVLEQAAQSWWGAYAHFPKGVLAPAPTAAGEAPEEIGGGEGQQVGMFGRAG